MDLNCLSARQAEFDRQHGWSTDTPEPAALIAGLQIDIVGLVGELGEFANLVQKIDRNRESGPDFPELDENRPALAEELADTFAYLLRLANRLGVNLEDEYLRKLTKNDRRFEKFRR